MLFSLHVGPQAATASHFLTSGQVWQAIYRYVDQSCFPHVSRYL